MYLMREYFIELTRVVLARREAGGGDSERDLIPLSAHLLIESRELTLTNFSELSKSVYLVCFENGEPEVISLEVGGKEELRMEFPCTSFTVLLDEGPVPVLVSLGGYG